MPPESESDRIDRIRDAQIGSRGRSHKQRSAGSGGTAAKKSSPQKSSPPKSKQQVDKKPGIKLPIIRANTLSNAAHDVLVGVGIGGIPALLMFLFLPGGFKLLGILVLLIGGVGGYLLGETAK
jgi:hypothetical protein